MSVLDRVEDYFVGSFEAMASPCTVLVDTDDRGEAAALLATAENEARRIEQKFSRYQRDNVVHRINHSEGRPIELDEETALLIDYASQTSLPICWYSLDAIDNDPASVVKLCRAGRARA
ncbi:MAG: FAD:protein FMN transferase, partial [Thermoanaerobaculia bacterium]